jgi:hypothetical protein
MEKMKEIVLEEGRPFSYQDFLQFNVKGKWYYMKPGTYRNSICALRKEGIIETCYNSNIAFHTLKGHRFGNNLMTPNHMGISSVTNVIPVTARYNMGKFHEYLKTLNSDKRSIHDIHLLFQVPDIWTIFSNNPKYQQKINSQSKDIILEPEIIDNMKIQTILHCTDSVTVSVACSKLPIDLEERGITKLSCALTRVEERLQRKLDECGQNLDGGYERIPIPDCNRWQVTMWHFGHDRPCEYKDKGYCLTWGNGREVIRTYVKNINGISIKREEKQEYPEKSLQDALMDKYET